MKKLAAMAAVTMLTACQQQTPAPAPSMKAGEPPATQAAKTPLVGKVGDTYVGRALDITVEQFNPSVTSQYSQKTWQAVLVKECAKADGVMAAAIYWQIVDSDSGRWDLAGEFYDDAPKPQFPMGDAPVAKGECVKGWITFDLPADKKATEIRYGSVGGGELVAAWKVQ